MTSHELVTDALSSTQAAFLGDSEFPRVAEENPKGGQITLFELLYEQYSRLQFTKDHDKPIAIAGLERRLCRAFNSDGGFGLFTRFLERSLLWQRATKDFESLTRIDFPPGQEYVPSWSWMAYRGGIEYMDLPFAGIDWTKEYNSPWAVASTTTRSVRDFSTSELNVVARDFVLDPDGQGCEIVWDGGTAIHGVLRCVAIGKLQAEAGRPTQKHYILILKQSDGGDMFERVGVGCLAKDKIDFSGTQRWSLVR